MNEFPLDAAAAPVLEPIVSRSPAANDHSKPFDRHLRQARSAQLGEASPIAAAGPHAPQPDAVDSSGVMEKDASQLDAVEPDARLKSRRRNRPNKKKLAPPPTETIANVAGVTRSAPAPVGNAADGAARVERARGAPDAQLGPVEYPHLLSTTGEDLAGTGTDVAPVATNILPQSPQPKPNAPKATTDHEDVADSELARAITAEIKPDTEYFAERREQGQSEAGENAAARTSAEAMFNFFRDLSPSLIEQLVIGEVSAAAAPFEDFAIADQAFDSKATDGKAELADSTDRASSADASGSRPSHAQGSPAGRPVTGGIGPSGPSQKGGEHYDPQAEVDRVRFVQRVSRAFQSLGNDEGQVRLRLSPPSLGTLLLEVTLRGGEMVARLETETAAAKNLLLDSLPALRERLSQHEVRIARFDVDLADHSGGGAAGRHAQPDDMPRRGSAAHRAQITAPPATPVSRRSLATNVQSLDVII